MNTTVNKVAVTGAIGLSLHTPIVTTKRDDLKKVDPRNIEIEPGFNKRVDYGDIESLARSVVECGVIEPIEGFKKRGEDKYILTDGHRRMAAVNLALKYHSEGKQGFEDISKIELIRLIPSSSDRKDRLYIMAITGEGKKPLTDLEKSEMYEALLEIAMAEGKKRTEAIKEIVVRLGVSQATVYNILQLSKLPETIKTAIGKGAISGSTVTTIIRDVKDETEQVRMVTEAIENAKETAVASGKAAPKKATAKNVKGMKAKTPIQKLKAVEEKLIASETKNTRATAFLQMMEILEGGGSVNKIYDLFV